MLLFLFVFSLMCSRGGCGATAAVLTLDIAVDESREKMADRVARSPARLCCRDGKLCYYRHRRFEYDFLVFFALVPCRLLFLRPYPGVFRFFVLLRPCSSHLLLFSNDVFFCVICLLPLFRIPIVLFVLCIFRSSYFIGCRFFCCALRPYLD